jgi:hypothetical protein
LRSRRLAIKPAESCRAQARAEKAELMHKLFLAIACGSVCAASPASTPIKGGTYIEIAEMGSTDHSMEPIRISTTAIRFRSVFDSDYIVGEDDYAKIVNLIHSKSCKYPFPVPENEIGPYGSTIVRQKLHLDDVVIYKCRFERPATDEFFDKLHSIFKRTKLESSGIDTWRHNLEYIKRPSRHHELR